MKYIYEIKRTLPSFLGEIAGILSMSPLLAVQQLNYQGPILICIVYPSPAPRFVSMLKIPLRVNQFRLQILNICPELHASLH